MRKIVEVDGRAPLHAQEAASGFGSATRLETLSLQTYAPSEKGSSNECLFDRGFAEEMSLLLADKSVCEFGGSLARYLDEVLMETKETAKSSRLRIEVKPWTAVESSLSGDETFDVAMALGIGQYTSKLGERVLLNNMAAIATRWIILSGPLHVLPGIERRRSASYLTFQMKKRGFKLEPRATELLRSHTSAAPVKRSILIFSRRHKGYNVSEISALLRIVGSDLDDFMRLNRKNSSLKTALLAKGLRDASSLFQQLERLRSLTIVLRYDLANLLRRESARRGRATTPNPVTFFPVCFTCGKHFRFLRLSLLSLKHWSPRIGRVFIYVDRADPLSEREVTQLRAELNYSLVFRKTRFTMRAWAGPKVQISELIAFQEIATEMSSTDFLMKFDSDILFISGGLFEFVGTAAAGAVGNQVSAYRPSEFHLDYMQGGCYFIRGRELEAITRMKAFPSSCRKPQLAHLRWGAVPEDEFMTDLLRRCGALMVYRNTMYWNPTFVSPRASTEEFERRSNEVPSSTELLHLEGGHRFVSGMRALAEKFIGPTGPTLNTYWDMLP
jgi:hypothetical protein